MPTDFLVMVVIVAFGLVTMPVFAVLRPKGANSLESSARGSFVLGSFVREWFYWFVRPAERISLALGLMPIFYNLTGVFFGIAAGVCFAVGQTSLAGWSVLLGGAADVLDGRIARGLGIASRRGAFLDSTLDRFAEVGAFVGLAVLLRDSVLGLALVTIALGGSLLVSYARARGESVGIVCKVGVMQRAERLLILGFAGVADSAVSGWLGREVAGGALVPAIGLIAVGTLGTAVYRTVWIARALPYLDDEADS